MRGPEGGRLFLDNKEAKKYLAEKLPKPPAGHENGFAESEFSIQAEITKDESRAEFNYRGINIVLEYQRYDVDLRDIEEPEGLYDEDGELSREPTLQDKLYYARKKLSWLMEEDNLPESATLNEIKNIIITAKDKQGKEVVLDKDELLPHDFTAFSSPEIKLNGYAGADTGIVLCSEISSLSDILIILHEAGHIALEKLKSDERKQADFKSWAKLYHLQYIAEPTDLAYMIDDERLAWAYALNKLRPLISDNPSSGLINRDDAIKFVNTAIGSSTFEEVFPHFFSSESAEPQGQ